MLIASWLPALRWIVTCQAQSLNKRSCWQGTAWASAIHNAGQLLAGQTSSGSVGGVARRLVRRHSWGGPLQMADTELPAALQQPPAATSMVKALCDSTAAAVIATSVEYTCGATSCCAGQ
jgi:hypothetical protein